MTAPRTVIVDNYDSFTYNLVHALQRYGAQCEVRRHDESLESLLSIAPDGFVISAGPCTPDEAGVSVALVHELLARPHSLPRIGLLGICLGHQCIATALGGRVVRSRPLHGKLCRIDHDGRGIFEGAANPLQAARYNSLVVDDVHDDLIVTARDEHGDVMGLRHRSLPIEGVQFHPESFLCPEATGLLGRWVAGLGRAKEASP